jgi:hypothetical protein
MMANLFDVDHAREGEPLELVVGDFLQWKRSDLVADYPPAEYSAEYVARITGGGANEIKLPSTENVNYYLFTVPSADSVDFEPGYYHWQLEITQTSSGNRVVVDQGDFNVLPDLDNNQADPRIHAEIMIAKIETILAGKADSDVSNYSIAGRSLTKLSFAELMDARDRYKRELVQHENKENAKRGRKTAATIKVRF